MKHILILLSLFISLTGFGQISLNLSDMLQVGDTVTRYVDTMTTQTAGPAGANKSWVMTTATAHQTLVTKGLAPSSTPYASSYSGSNLAMTNDNLSYLYCNQNSSTSVITGAAGDLLMTGCNINSPFVPDMLLHNFPRTYGDNFADNYGMDVTIDGSCINQSVIDKIRLKHISTIYDSTDGYGTITTPVGTYVCLRIKRTDFSQDSTWVKPFFPPNWSLYSTKKDTSYSYSWVTKEGKLAIAELANDSMDNPKKFTWSSIKPMTASVQVISNATCYGACDGSAIVTVSGFYPPYTFAWANGETTSLSTALCSGANAVTVTDSVGNSAILSVNISEPAGLAVSASVTNASSSSAADGSATITVSGGVSPYSYLWNNGQAAAAATGLAPGNYSVTVTDGNGCTEILPVSVNFGVGLNTVILTGGNYISFYPNPASEKIYFSGHTAGCIFSVTDISGKEVFRDLTGHGPFSVDLSLLKEGIYFFWLRDSEGLSVGKGKFAVKH